MTKEKQIEEMANAYYEAMLKARGTLGSMNNGAPKWYAKELYNAGYRKIYDDHQRQCTCYALGCQMAEQLKREVAEEIFADIHESINAETFHHKNFGAIVYLENIDLILAELKKKYTEDKNTECQTE